MDLATIWDFHFVWYRDDLVQPWVKLEQLNFGLRDPNFHTRHTHALNSKLQSMWPS